MYKFLNTFRKIYWFIFRPKTFGVKALILKNDKILVVNHSYENLLMLPGGKINNNEKPEDAIVREIKEELSIDICDPKLFGTYKSTSEYKKDTVYLYIVRNFRGNPSSKSHEIDKYIWVDNNRLPKNISRATERRLQEFFKKTPRNINW